MSIKQCQSTLEGKLTILNPTGGVVTSTSNASYYGDLRSLYSNIIEYNIFTSPESPNIRIIQDGEEVSSIVLPKTPAEITVEIITPQPVSVFKGSSTIDTNTTRPVGSLRISDTGVSNYYISKDLSVFSTDGYFHCTLHLIPTRTNNSQSPIKLGDLTLVSRIYDLSCRSGEWILVPSGSQALDSLKILLRTDNPRIVNLGSDGALPPISSAIPGTAYLYGAGTYYYVYPEFGLIKEVRDQSLFDYIEPDSKYYYQQLEIDNTFGASEREISIIQSGNFYYRLVRNGNTSGMLNFLGDTRTFTVQRIDVTTTPPIISSYSGYRIYDELNCSVTRSGSGDLTMIAPSRISGYSPYDLTATGYTSLANVLPVSFTVKVDKVDTGNMETVGDCLQLPGASSAGDSIIFLPSKPAEGTSGLDRDYDEVYHKEDITGLYEYVNVLETYTETNQVLGSTVETVGYTTKLSTTWNTSNISEDDLSTILAERIEKYGSSSLGLVGYVSGTRQEDLPVNTEDILIEAVEFNYTPQTGDTVEEILVDDFPSIVSLSYGHHIVKYRRKEGSSAEVVKTFQPNLNNTRVTVLTPNCEWSNYRTIKDLYHSMGIAKDINGYYWKYGLPLWVNPNNVLMANPDDWDNPTCPDEAAGYSNYGTGYYLWMRQDSDPGVGRIDSGSLPLTKGEAGDSWYFLDGYYYKATGNYYSCDVTNHYVLVALSQAPDVYDLNKTYSKGDLVASGTYTYTSKTDRNIGNTLPSGTGSNSYWDYHGDIKTYSGLFVKYRYYEIDLNMGDISNFSAGSITTDTVMPITYTYDYFGKLYASGKPRVEKYYRRGYDFKTGDINNDGDHGVCITNSGVKTICSNRIFKVEEASGNTYYYELKPFAVEAALPDNFNTGGNGRGGSLSSTNLPGNTVLKGDVLGTGFGVGEVTGLGTKLIYDFNQYKIKHSVFDEDIDYTQRSTPYGLVSNFGSTGYKLYLGNDAQNDIEIHLNAEDTSFSGFIGVYNIQNPISETSSGMGSKPGLVQNLVYGDETVSLDNPVLDGNNTPNFNISFPANNGDQDLTREFDFSVSDGSFVSHVHLRIIQGTNPGEVIPSPLSGRTLYFLSNGVPYKTFEFASNIQGLDLQNIQVLNDYGEDMLDRDEAFVQELNQSTTFTNYSAFLKLKPNTRCEVFSGFRIKIGRVSGGTVTDRTLDETSAKFYRLDSSSTWVLLDNTYQPTYKEPYYDGTTPPSPSSFNEGDVICVCQSLRGYQGYYATYLYNLNYSGGYDLMWKSATTLDEVIADLTTFESFTPGTNFIETLEGSVIISTSLPDIKTMREVGVIYKIGNIFYYTFADRIVSGYTYGTVNLPNYISSSGSATQKYHLEILQREYDGSGILSSESSMDAYLGNGQNYTLSDPGFLTSWTLLDSSIPPHPLTGITGDEICSGDIIFSETPPSPITPYFMNSYTFYTGSPILVKTELRLKLKYNNQSGLSMDEEYKWVKYLFTLYTKWSNS